jgi:phage shock protein C
MIAMTRRRRKRRSLYRSRRGWLLGVCRGLAEYFDVEVKWVRLVAAIALLVTGFWPAVAVYLLAAWFMKPEPSLPLESEMEEEFYNSYARSRSMALRRLKRDYDAIDRRIQRMESAVTTREFQWQRRLDEQAP